MSNQQGATLIMTVILLLLLSLFGLMIFHVSESEVRMAGLVGKSGEVTRSPPVPPPNVEPEIDGIDLCASPRA